MTYHKHSEAQALDFRCCACFDVLVEEAVAHPPWERIVEGPLVEMPHKVLAMPDNAFLECQCVRVGDSSI